MSLNPKLRSLLEAAALALGEANVPRLEAPSVIKRALQGFGKRAVERPPPESSREHIPLLEWFARELEYSALQGDDDKAVEAFLCIVQFLFSWVGDEPPLALSALGLMDSPPALAELPAEPGAMLDAVRPPPRVLAVELAVHAVRDRSVPALRRLLTSASVADRVLALRALSDEAIGPLADELARALFDNPNTSIRLEAHRALNGRSGKCKRELAARAKERLVSGDARQLAATLAKLSVVGASEELISEEALVAALAHGNIEVRRAAVMNVEVSHVQTEPARLLPLLAGVLEDSPSGERAAYLIHRSGVDASTIAEELVCALAYPHCKRAWLVLLKVRRLSPDTIVRLQALVLGPDSEVARLAREILQEKAAEALVELSPAQQQDRIRRELASDEPATQAIGIRAVEALAREHAEPLLPLVVEVGARASERDDNDMVSLSRNALFAHDWPRSEMPREKSRLEPYDGYAAHEWLVVGPYMIGTIRDTMETHVGGVIVSKGAIYPRRAEFMALGVWDNATGNRVVVFENACSIAIAPALDQVAILGIVDEVWLLERFSLSALRPLCSTRLPAEAARSAEPWGVSGITIEGDRVWIRRRSGRVESILELAIEPEGDRLVGIRY